MRITIPLYKSLKEIATVDDITYRGAISRLHRGEYVRFDIPRKQKIWKDGVSATSTKMVSGYIRKAELIKIIYNILSDDGNKESTGSEEADQAQETSTESQG